MSALGKSLPKQSFNICSKIRELDEFLSSTRGRFVVDRATPGENELCLVEGHPELAFWHLRRGTSVGDVELPKKKTAVTKKFTGGRESGRMVSPSIH